MSKFTPSVFYETEFEGDKISMRLSRLKRAHMMKLVQLLDIDKETRQVSEGSIIKCVDYLADELPGYIQDFKGLKDEDGNAITLQEVINEGYFLYLLSDIVGQLMHISKLGKVMPSNSEEPQAE